MGMFSSFFRGEESIKENPIGRENLGGSAQAIPATPDNSSPEAANLTPDAIKQMIEQEEREVNPDYDRIKHLRVLLENKVIKN